MEEERKEEKEEDEGGDLVKGKRKPASQPFSQPVSRSIGFSKRWRDEAPFFPFVSPVSGLVVFSVNFSLGVSFLLYTYETDQVNECKQLSGLEDCI